jgi:hypothetical protein
MAIRPADLEERGVPRVREMLRAGEFGQVGSPNYDEVSEWLRFKESERGEAREGEHLHIARKALHNSRWAQASQSSRCWRAS